MAKLCKGTMSLNDVIVADDSGSVATISNVFILRLFRSDLRLARIFAKQSEWELVGAVA